MKNIYIFQPQYDVDYRGDKQYWIPYSAGTLWAYVSQFDDIRDNFCLADIIFRREDLDQVLARMEDPVLCAFSCYQWNRTYCLTAAQRIRQRWPGCFIVFGGPETTLGFLDHDYIDTVVMGEGELAFRDILQSLSKSQTPEDVYRRERIENLDIPSPYAMGIFDPLIQRHPDALWATTLETNRGCPFSCTFCDWGSVTYSKIKRFSLERVREDLDWISRNPITYVVCADANFGIFKERDLIIAEMVSEAGRKNPRFEVFNATFNKNNNEWSFRILEALGELNRGFTVSVQSMNPDTLRAIKRDNLGINDLEKIFRLAREHGVTNSYTELILGLPLETNRTFRKSICDLLELGQHGQIEVYFTDLLVNSELGNALTKRTYGIKTVRTRSYLTLTDPEHDDGLGDEIEIVCATSTMSTAEMVDAYMFGWLVMNLHHQGFSQVVSKYLRHHGHSYHDIYHAIEVDFKTHHTLGRIWSNTRDMIEKFLTTGELPPGRFAHNMILNSARSIYDHKTDVFALLDSVMQRFSCHDHSISKLQKLMIFDANHCYPMEISLDTDPNDFESRTSTWMISNRYQDSLQHFEDAYYNLRRKGALKNRVVEIASRSLT
jgi:putative methyltransferase